MDQRKKYQISYFLEKYFQHYYLLKLPCYSEIIKFFFKVSQASLFCSINVTLLAPLEMHPSPKDPTPE